MELVAVLINMRSVSKDALCRVVSDSYWWYKERIKGGISESNSKKTD